MNLVMNSGQLVCYKKRPTSRANNNELAHHLSAFDRSERDASKPGGETVEKLYVGSTSNARS